MTRAEKESRIVTANGPFPSWQELVELAQQERKDRLARMDDPKTEEIKIERDYDAALDRILGYIARP